MNNYRANQARLMRSTSTGRVVAKPISRSPLGDLLTIALTKSPLGDVVATALTIRPDPPYGSRTITVSGGGQTRCPLIGERQWTCTREQCTCHLKLRAHTAACGYRSGGWPIKCTCGALT